MSTFVFDIDGTISQGGEKVHPAICDSIQSLRKEHQVVFASARPVRDMLPMLSVDLRDVLCIGCNGGMAYQNSKLVYQNMLCSGIVLEIINFLRIKKIPYVLDGPWNYSFSQTQHAFHQYIRSLSSHECSEKTILSQGVSKILILNNSDKEELLRQFCYGNNLSVHSHRPDEFYDITPAGNNKFLTYNSLTNTKNYVAFGNDQNDFLLLNNADISVFIGDEEIYPNADYYISTEYVPTLIEYLKSQLEKMPNPPS